MLLRSRSAPPQPTRPVPGRARLLAIGLAVLVALTVVAALVALAAYERREALENAENRVELIARTLEDHVTRTVDSAALILQTLDEGIGQQRSSQPEPLQHLLSQSLLSSLPFLRGVAVLAQDGTVLASSVPAERGLRVDLARLAPSPREGKDRMLALQAGRSLADLATGDATRPPAGVGMLPLVRALSGPDGRPLLLVALINPGALANFQQVAVADEGGVALLASWDGRLVAVNDALALEPGRPLAGHPVFQNRLAQREHGEYLGAGAQPGTQVVAYRASRSRPLVVIVELAERRVLHTWYGRLGWLALVGGLALAAIAGGLRALLREMDTREQARTALDGAYRQVAQRERELSVLLKSVQELIFRTDAEGAITYVNARWGALSGAVQEPASGRRFWDLAVPADRLRTADLFRPDDRLGVRRDEVCIPGADGGLRHFQVSVVPLHGDGQIIGFAGSALDVSERVASDQRLQHQLHFTGLLLEISPLPVSMFDMEGRYVMVNQAWEDFVGRPRADVIGSVVGHFLTAADAALHAEQDARLLAHGGRIRYETQVRHHDGSRRDMVVTKVLVPGDAGPAGILCTLMDVSEFRDAERATSEARDAAEEASRSKSEFVANISHELRTPLQAILGFSELGATRGREHAKLASMFSNIHASGQRMLHLVNDLLDVAKIESAVGTFHLERWDLRGIVQAVLRELDPLLAQRGLRLTLRLADEPLVAKVDASRIHQAIRNVVANAIKFSPEGGELDIEAAATMRNEVQVSVADRGPGIPPAELEAIFEAFVQSSQTKDGSGGTGLGLAICRKIVEIHGGRITAENRAGGGAVFRLTLPLRAAADADGATAPASLD
ncbi:ATP-binding protein [Roseateles cellulosilyticus]|uniref:histidine kinase n=1 Tax=Pelomonas cellulosilytica TaxID=2906762 RepID=A0ABS8XVR0_9BURK|nr:ATP-binding protein [Pelomonas sp. P8]MCE4556744.1 ATP-binding protein [Pelomonas sp. P8]